MNKKAQNMNINVIIIVILAVLVLLILVLSFTGGMTTAIDKIKEVFSRSTATTLDEAKTSCDLWCSQESYKTWCGYEFEKIPGASKDNPKYCNDISSCPDAGC